MPHPPPDGEVVSLCGFHRVSPLVGSVEQAVERLSGDRGLVEPLIAPQQREDTIDQQPNIILHLLISGVSVGETAPEEPVEQVRRLLGPSTWARVIGEEPALILLDEMPPFFVSLGEHPWEVARRSDVRHISDGR